jgi:GxxExxY protein
MASTSVALIGIGCATDGCLLATHEAQLLTYLRMSGCQVGLLLNFNAVRLKDGLRRRVRSQQDEPA